MALGLDLDPVKMLHLWFADYEPNTWRAARPRLDDPLNSREKAILAARRTGSVAPCDTGPTLRKRENLANFLALLPVEARGKIRRISLDTQRPASSSGAFHL